MLKHAPPHLWAITKGDRAYCELMLDSFDWLFERVRATCGLRHPRDAWPSWQDAISTCPGRFKGWIKRALALERVADKCAADHVAFYKLCRSQSGAAETPDESLGQASLPEACLICRKGKAFASKLAWARHAARVHQYRTNATKLARGCICLGCGKVYANAGRLKRHLGSALLCQQRWGSFLPDDAAASAHPQMPPQRAAGEWLDSPPAAGGADFEAVLLESLEALAPCSVDATLDVFRSAVQPLSTPKAVAERWRASRVASNEPHAVASQVVSLLRPEVVCQGPSKCKTGPRLDDNEFPVFAPLQSFCSTMDCEFTIPVSPSATPVWPWAAYGTLREARKRQEWAGAALRICADAVRAVGSSPASIAASEASQQALHVALSWLVQGGFSCRGSSGLSLVSPRIHLARGAS